jgi:radical SAM superfamily enzyme YgiQ (UPF0313 family)
MNVLLISLNRSTVPMPVMPIGACIVAEAAEHAGHSVALLDLMFAKNPFSAIRSAVIDKKPEVIGLSIRNIDNNDMRDTTFFLQDFGHIIKTIRGLTKNPVILGGAALSIMPEEILGLGDISCGVLGDGETTFPHLIEQLGRNGPIRDIPGVASIENDIFRMNPRPVPVFTEGRLAPDYGKWLNVRAYQSYMATAPIQTKTGCPFKCVYCTYHKIEGSTYQFSEPGQVVDAVARLTSSGLRDIEFVDSVFNEPYDHAIGLCEALACAGLQARLQSYDLNPRSFDDELVYAMERAGFVGMGITVESASDSVLEGLRKGFSSRDVAYAAEVVQRHHLPCTWIFMLGGPGETRETVRQTLRFAQHSIRRNDVAIFNIGIRIYPGTELERIARNQGVVTVPADRMLNPLFYVSPEVSADWIKSEVAKLMDRHLNFLDSGSLGFPLLPAINRIGRFLGVKPPLWRHTRFIRRGVRFLGLDA